MILFPAEETDTLLFIAELLAILDTCRKSASIARLLLYMLFYLFEREARHSRRLFIFVSIKLLLKFQVARRHAAYLFPPTDDFF